MGRDRWLLARDEFSAAATGTSGASSGPHAAGEPPGLAVGAAALGGDLLVLGAGEILRYRGEQAGASPTNCAPGSRA
jgi:hypothetical protein